jgi:small basic protein (TIGR04137 family)
MTMDKSLKVRLGLARARSVLSRDERIQRLKAADRWQEGDDPFGLPKVRVFKLAMKKKKKKKEEGEEGAEGAAATPAAAEPAKKDAGKKDAGKKEGAKSSKK